MTIREAIAALSSAGVPDSEYSAREIFLHFGGISMIDITLGRAESGSEEVVRAIARRAEREPLQYILGFTDFYRERYTVTPDCLIPRSDTELLVDIAVSELPEAENFADLCTGSGCVGISTLKNTKGTRATLVDISDAALAVAEKNARDNGVSDRAVFLKLDLMQELPQGEFYAFLSNPPYVSRAAYKELPEELYAEPSIAFLGGEDGADFYRSLTPRLKQRLKPRGFIAYEIGYDQADILRDIAGENSMTCRIYKDLSGNDRVALLRNRE